MPSSMKKIKQPCISIRRLDGKIVPEYNYTRSHIQFEDDGFICTCGNKYRHMGGLYAHKKTLSHLILTKQINEYHPTLTVHEQRDMLFANNTRIW